MWAQYLGGGDYATFALTDSIDWRGPMHYNFLYDFDVPCANVMAVRTAIPKFP